MRLVSKFSGPLITRLLPVGFLFVDFVVATATSTGCGLDLLGSVAPMQLLLCVYNAEFGVEKLVSRPLQNDVVWVKVVNVAS